MNIRKRKRDQSKNPAAAASMLALPVFYSRRRGPKSVTFFGFYKQIVVAVVAVVAVAVVACQQPLGPLSEANGCAGAKGVELVHRPSQKLNRMHQLPDELSLAVHPLFVAKHEPACDEDRKADLLQEFNEQFASHAAKIARTIRCR